MDAVFDAEAEIGFIRLAVVRPRTLKREISVSLVRSSAFKESGSWAGIRDRGWRYRVMVMVGAYHGCDRLRLESSGGGTLDLVLSCRLSVTKKGRRLLEGYEMRLESLDAGFWSSRSRLLGLVGRDFFGGAVAV